MLSGVDWKGKLVQPAQCRCPAGCGSLISHASLSPATKPLAKLVKHAAKAAATQAREEGLEGTAAELEAKYSIYQCGVCQKVFCGGRRECNVDGGGAEDKDSVCESCQLKGGGRACSKHGSEFIVGKCNYCCEEATFNCGGGKYLFCTPCHVEAAVAFHEGWFSEWEKSKIPEIPHCDPTRCPFGGRHPGGAPRKPTYGWRSLCTACNALGRLEAQPPAQGTSDEPTCEEEATCPVVTLPKCATPGCEFAVHHTAASWNGHGKYCCGGCMEHAAQVTMHRATLKSAPSERCHDARCNRSKPGAQELCKR